MNCEFCNDFANADVLNILFSGVVAALVSAVFAWIIASGQELRQARRSLFGKLMASRSMPLPKEFFEALNEVPATFAGKPAVLRAWKVMLQDGQGQNSSNLVSLLRSIAKASGSNISGITDEELSTPFVAGAGNKASSDQ